MIQLSKRQKEILKILSQSKSPVKVRQLAGSLKVSERTIRYDLDEIEYFLKQIETKMIRKSKVGIYLENKDKLIENLMKWEKDNSFVPYLDKDERLLYIGLYLVTCDKPVSSEEIANALAISRSTILSDLRELGKKIEEEFSIRLWAKKRHGYTIMGEENKVRDYLTYLVKRFLEMKMNGHRIYEFSEGILDLIYSFDVHQIRKAIKICKGTIPFWIPYESYLMVVARIKVLMYRIKIGKLYIPNENVTHSLKGKKEFLISKEIAHQLSDIFDQDIPEAEIINLTYYLIFCNLKIVNDNDRMVDPKLVDTVYEMIRILQNYILLKPDAIKSLKEELISHLELTLEKIQLNIPNVNHLIEDIRNKYFEEFHVAKMMLNHFENLYKVKVSDDEIGFITMYILKNKEQSIKKPSKNVLVVCCSGKGASKLLATRIINNIPNIIIKDIVSIFEIEENEYDTSSIDLIISTIPIRNSSKPVIKVSPLITNNELGKISRILFNEDISEFEMRNFYSNNFIDSVKKQVSPFLDIDKESLILKKLESIFVDYEESQKNDVLNLNEFSKASHTIGMILVEIGNMLQSLYNENYISYEFMNQWGLILHIILAIPRWKTGSFNVEPDLDYYKNNYTDIYAIVKNTLHNIESKFELRIKEAEVAAIMRYLV